MERDTGKDSMEETDIDNKRVAKTRTELGKEIPANFGKYEGKTESAHARRANVLVSSAREIGNPIGELSAIIFFLRKSS